MLLIFGLLVIGISILDSIFGDKPKETTADPVTGRTSYVQQKLDEAQGYYEQAMVAVEDLPINDHEKELARRMAKRRFLNRVRELVGDPSER